MARPWRVQFPGAVYHVMARGNDRQDIFLEDSDRLDMIDLLSRAASRFKLDIFSFCLMSNHYHLFMRTREPNLARAMQWLNGSYTNRFNRSHSRSGHLLQGRYKSVLVTDEAHWLHLSIYIHLNPVLAGMVEKPTDYEWSSCRDFTRIKKRFDWLQPDDLLASYGHNDRTRRNSGKSIC